MRFMLFAFMVSVLASTSFAQIGRVKITKVVYTHSTVGTSAADAILASIVERNIKGWTVCHDAGSASTFLSFSDGADPDVDGTRLEAAQCFFCSGCSFKTLVNLNVKGSAAGTGYSILQQK